MSETEQNNNSNNNSIELSEIRDSLINAGVTAKDNIVNGINMARNAIGNLRDHLHTRGRYTDNLMSRGYTPQPSRDIERVLREQGSIVDNQDVMRTSEASSIVYQSTRSPEFQSWMQNKINEGYTVTPLLENDDSGLARAVIVSKGSEHMVIVRGTSEMNDFMTDARLNAIPMSRTGAPGHVISGFDSYSADIAALVQQNINLSEPGTRITF